MAGIAQVLLLPAPTPVQQRLPSRDNSELTVNPDAQKSNGDDVQARRFRFRVYEGRESSEINVDYAARGTNNRTTSGNGSSTEDATGQASSGRLRYANGYAGKGNSSAFLAQAFAQEQLGEGLHNPPYAQASAAYSSTGAAVTAPASVGVNITV